MSVIVDQQPLAIGELELKTVGQVLDHLQQRQRLVAQILRDGQTPDLKQLDVLRQAPLVGHTLYIETADARQLAVEVLAETAAGLQTAETLKAEAIQLLARNQSEQALTKLAGCFQAWQQTQQAVLKVGQALKTDLSRLHVPGAPAGQSLVELLEEYAGQLQQIKSALENRDYVLLSDILNYEMAQSTAKWQAALEALRRTAT